MENMERTIERIKKLMTLAMSDPDTPEAKAAAKKAAELLAKYELDMADLTEENKNDILEERFKNYNPFNMDWERKFIGVLMSTFDIYGVTDISDPKQASYRLFGKKQDIVLCSYFFKMVRRIAVKKGEELYRTQKMRTAFQEGLITAIAWRFYEMKQARQDLRTETTTALAVQNQADVAKYVRDLFGDALQKGEAPKQRKITTREEYEAYTKGEKIGKDIPLHTPLEGEFEQATGIN